VLYLVQRQGSTPYRTRPSEGQATRSFISYDHPAMEPADSTFGPRHSRRTPQDGTVSLDPAMSPIANLASRKTA